MLKYLKYFFLKNKTQTQNLCNISISLKENKEIDLSVYINEEKIKNNILDPLTQECAEFLHIVNTGKLKNKILSIILDQINNKNQTTIENILLLLIMLEQKELDTGEAKDQDQSFILPSTVFTRYVNINNQ